MLGLGLSLWSSTILGRGADPYGVLGFRADLVFDFGTETYRTKGSPRSFDEAITYTGASNKTMVDSDGLLKWAPHNLALWSEDFTQWAVDNSGATNPVVTANAATAPDGTLTADRIQLDKTGGVFSRVLRAVTGLPSGLYTFSVWMRKNGSGAANVGIRISGVGVNCVVTEEWQRFSVTLNSAGSDGASQILLFDSISGNDETADIFAWGAHTFRSDLGGMVNNPDRGDSYVPTTTAARYLPRRGHHVYNGSAWVNEGLLVESEARTNLLLYSSEFDNAAWTKSNTTITANVATAPDGTTSADKVVEIATSAAKGVFQTVTPAGANVVFSCWFKKAERSYAYMKLFSQPGGVSGRFSFVVDLDTGAITDTNTSGADLGVLDYGAEDWGNGWYRLYSSISNAAGASTNFNFGPSNAATPSWDAFANPVYTGDGTSGIYVWGGDIQEGTALASHLPTSGATVTRAAETLTVAAADLPYPTPRVIGPELVTNGTFDTDVSGWIIGQAVGSIDNSRLQLTNSGAVFGYASRAFTTEVGKVYQASCDFVKGTAASGYLRAGTTVLGLNYVNVVRSTDGPLSGLFVAQGTTTYVHVLNTNQTDAFNIYDNISVREIDPLSVSIQMQGRMTYADEDNANEVVQYLWQLNSDNQILARINTSGAENGRMTFLQESLNVLDAVAGDFFDPGINVPFNIASRHGSTFINGAVDGTALTADTTPVALPNLSATNLNLATPYMGTVKLFRMWGVDIGDTGLEEATT